MEIEELQELSKLMINYIIKYVDDEDLDINDALNSLFPETDEERDDFFKIVEAFIKIGTFSDINDEVPYILTYINNRDTIFEINKDNTGDVYLIIASLIEADMKSRNGGFLKRFDICLTRNIERIQRKVKYDLDQTPIIPQLLDIISPVLDIIDIESIITNKFLK